MKFVSEIENTIKSLREEKNVSLRCRSDSLENVLYSLFPVLDHGFVRVIDYMGNDSAVVQAARVSYGKGTKHSRSDVGLIRYLMRHRHTTPFEMCEIKFHIKLPIFVARQWIRHRTASVNEYSARYSKLDNEFYIPQPENLVAQSTSNRQGGGVQLPECEKDNILNILNKGSEQAYEQYEEMLSEDEQNGLSRELARMNLPTSIYTQWYWKINLLNLLKFVSLRADSHAQWEIQEYAKQIAELIQLWVPITYQAFEDYWLDGASLSKQQLELIKAMNNGEKISFESSGLSRREWDEFCDILAISNR
ncbi:MAG: FAD-dependent thymidylate synthase [Rhodobacteraceae bacterium]|nr:FAD-dependent thymidylate synthase [Paracoccaceae bacterium]